MHFEAFGRTYYLNEKSFVERMTQARSATETDHPWRIEEIVTIQNRMRSFDEFIAIHLKHSATPDPLQTLRQHIDGMLTGESSEN